MVELIWLGWTFDNSCISPPMGRAICLGTNDFSIPKTRIHHLDTRQLRKKESSQYVVSFVKFPVTVWYISIGKSSRWRWIYHRVETGVVLTQVGSSLPFCHKLMLLTSEPSPFYQRGTNTGPHDSNCGPSKPHSNNISETANL